MNIRTEYNPFVHKLDSLVKGCPNHGPELSLNGPRDDRLLDVQQFLFSPELILTFLGY